MGTFTNPSSDISIVANPPLSGSGRTWDEATETWNENTNTWNDPYLPEINPSAHISTVINASTN